MFDLITAIFIGVSALLIWINVYSIYKAKQAQGVHIMPHTVFTAWAFWDIYMFWHIGFYMASICSLAIGIANGTWFILYWYYKRKKT